MNFKIKINSIVVFSVLLLLMMNASSSHAQEAQKPVETDMSTYYNILLLFLALIVSAVFIALSIPQKTEAEIAADLLKEKKISILKKLKDKLSGLQPVETEKNLILEGNHDGITELDNNVPPWFNILFYGTIVIALIYMLNYHVFKIGKLPLQEYLDEVYAAELLRDELIRTGAFINENSVELLKDNESLKNGKQIFSANCVTCHGEKAQGTVGPNLADEYWIHGGGIKKVFSTIKYGVPAKGMITWKNQFNPMMIQQVASYIISLQGTNPPYGKLPEGEKYIEISDSTKLSADSTNTENIKKDSLRSMFELKNNR